MTKKILIDARLYGLEHAGLGRYTLNLVKELALLDRKNKYVLLLRKKYYKQLELPDNWKKVLAEFKHYSFKEQISLTKMIRKESPDIVHFPHLNVPVFFKGNFIVTLHDMIMHKSKGKDATTLPFYKYLIKRLGYKLIFRNAVFKSRKIIVPSNAIKRELKDYYGIKEDKLKVTYEGLDDKIVPKGNKKDVLTKYGIREKYFIYVGNAYPHKNLERAIEAVSFINKNSKEKTLFVIVSSRNVFTKRLKKAIKKQRAEKYVRLLGFIPDNELGVLLQKSIAFCYPSLNEGFGLQGLESIASGTLVIASDIPVFNEVYKDNVIYFNPYDFSSIAQVMKKAKNISLQEREKMINKGQQFIKKYSWSKMAKQTQKIYIQSVG